MTLNRTVRSPAIIPFQLLGDDLKTIEFSKQVTPLEGYTDVTIHGSPDSFGIKTNKEWTNVTHRDLANYLSKQGIRRNKIRLLSCSTGSSVCGVGQNLANKLGVEVLAPSDILWIDKLGKLTIGRSPGQNTGSWVLFKPGH